MGKKWTKEELDILEREYPKGGMKAVRSLFPDRTAMALKGKVEYLQLRVENHSNHIRQEPTDMIDAAIKRAYLNGKPDLKKLAKTWNRTHGWMKWRAMNLGLSKAAHGAPTGPWLPEENRLLENCLDNEYGISTIYKRFQAAGFRRTLSAIANRVRTLDLRFSRAWWNASDVARALEIETHSVLKWIAEGKLKAERKRCPGYDHLPIPDGSSTLMWKIKPAAVRKFLIENPQMWDHRRMRKEVLLDLLCGGDEGLARGIWGATG